MKRLITKAILILISIFVSFVAWGQTGQKVAVYVTGADGEGINEFIGAYLVDAIVNRSDYQAVERTADFIRELNKEQEYQRTGAVDDGQISQLGQQFGVQLVCVAKVAKVGDRQFVSARLIDVETATVKKSTKPVFFTMNNIDKSCSEIAISLVSGNQEEVEQPTRTTAANRITRRNNESEKMPQQPAVQQRQTVQMPVYVALTADKMNIYHDGVLLGKEQINQAFAQSIALDIYKAGKRRNNWGTGMVLTGYAALGFGIGLVIGTIIEGGYYDYDYSTGNEYYVPTDYSFYLDGGGFIAAGGGLLIGGYKLKSTAKTKIKEAVNVHNNSFTSSNVELNVGFTQNGIGLVLNF